MQKIIEAIVELFKVKSLITLGIVGTLIYLALTGIVEIAIFTTIASSILTYYFSRKGTEPKESDDIDEELIKKIEKIIDAKEKTMISNRPTVCQTNKRNNSCDNIQEVEEFNFDIIDDFINNSSKENSITIPPEDIQEENS